MLTKTIFSGFGGQGVLSIGFTVANAAMYGVNMLHICLLTVLK